MKKIIAVPIVLLNIFLASCFDTEEKITINNDNSGTYLFSMDMGQMIQQIKNFSPAEAGSLPDKKDTTIYLRTITDTIQGLSVNEKQLLQRGTLNIHIDNDSNQMRIAFMVPFDNINQLVYLKQHLAEMISKIKSPQGLMGNNDLPMNNNGGLGGDSTNQLLFNPGQQAFTFNINNNTISNRLTNKSLIEKTFSADSSVQMILQMASMMGDPTYKTTFILPAPVKKYIGPESQLSEDKKTITFTSTLTEFMDKPESLEYSVEY